MYLGFTPMDYLWLEPLEIFVQITWTSMNCFQALLPVSMCTHVGSSGLFLSRISDEVWARFSF
jgi:hypothetical protein